MTNEQLNAALFDKISAEQGEYQNWLVSMYPEQALDHAYEYAIREDIRTSLEDHNLPDAEVRALLKSPTPLADIYKEWQNRETEYMDKIWETVESHAKSALQQAQEKAAKQKVRDSAR